MNKGWNFNFDFIRRMHTLLWISIIACGLSLVALLGLGLNFGTDFAGGYEIQVQLPKATTESQIRDVLSPLGLGDARIQRFGTAEDNEYLIMVRGQESISDETKQQLKTDFEAIAQGPDNIINWSIAESGERLVIGFSRPISEAQVREVLGRYNLEVKAITRGEREDRPEYSVELISLVDKMSKALQQGLGISEATELVGRVDFVGPQVGAQLRNQGIMAVLYSLLFIFLYVAWRFDLFFSPGAIIATAHDALITLGVFAVFQIEFNLTVVAAVLTLIGFSLNDTVVIYDRIRENVARLRGRELRPLVNTSINETLSRTILTNGTVFLVVVALLAFGGEFIRGFSIAMLVGVIVGTYSSIAIASPIYILLKEHYHKDNNSNHKVAAA